MNSSNTSGKWFLATIISGIAVAGWEAGRHVYVRSAPDGRIQVRGKGGLTATIDREWAKLLFKTVRNEVGGKVIVAQQERWSEEWNRRHAA